MRCVTCGWVVEDSPCPCGATSPARRTAPLAVGTRVAFRFGRGPSMPYWSTGEVAGQQGSLYKIANRGSFYWCAADDLIPEAPERDRALQEGTRVWALWVDGRWFPGVLDDQDGPIRHVTWDDGDSMWLEPTQIVVQATGGGAPTEGAIVLAKHWNGNQMPARVEQRDGARFRIVFQDGEESWVPGDDLTTFPPNPFGHG